MNKNATNGSAAIDSDDALPIIQLATEIEIAAYARDMLLQLEALCKSRDMHTMEKVMHFAALEAERHITMTTMEKDGTC